MISWRQAAALGAVVTVILMVNIYRRSHVDLGGLFLAATTTSDPSCPEPKPEETGCRQYVCSEGQWVWQKTPDKPNCCDAEFVTEDCPDNNPNDCSTPYCQTSNNTCQQRQEEDCCENAGDCGDDGEVCTQKACVNKECTQQPITGCCEHDNDCDDGKACTAESCDPQTNQCVGPTDDPNEQKCKDNGGTWDDQQCSCACPNEAAKRIECRDNGGDWNADTCECECDGVKLNEGESCVQCGASSGGPDCREQCDRMYPGNSQNDKREECVANCICDCRGGGTGPFDGEGDGTASACFKECCTTERKGAQYNLCDENPEFAAGCRTKCIKQECPAEDDDDDDDGGSSLPCILDSEGWKNLVTTCGGRVTHFCPNGTLRALTLYTPNGQTCSCMIITYEISSCSGGGGSSSSSASSRPTGDDDDDDDDGGSGDQCSPQCSQPECGNGQIEWGEECDSAQSGSSQASVPGATTKCEDCSNKCLDLVTGEWEDCPDTCGDHDCDAPGETCDTCSQDCGECQMRCGDGTVDPGEDCDDGNLINDDGCNNFCSTCDGSNPADCQATCCGNGEVEDGEQCDDGNDVDDDDCTNSCTLPMCGDGITQAGEDCDSGSLGEINQCEPEPPCTPVDVCNGGFACSAEEGCVPCDDLTSPTERARNGTVVIKLETREVVSELAPGVTNLCCEEDGTCEPTSCGNGIIDPGEECDDDNLVNGDGCSSECLLCDYDDFCQEDEDCSCSDCFGEQNGCEAEQVCGFDQETGEPMCVPCNQDGICSEGEGCSCQDCVGEQDGCEEGDVCGFDQDTGEPICVACDNNGECDADEDCSCSDCTGEQNGCEAEQVCGFDHETGDPICVPCNDDEVCQEGEDCSCADCFGEQNGCEAGEICGVDQDTGDVTCVACDEDNACEEGEDCSCSDCLG